MATPESRSPARETVRSTERVREIAAPIKGGVSIEANIDHPSYSEDAALLEERAGFAAVFDGMSNPIGTGGEASRIAREHARGWPAKLAELGNVPFDQVGRELGTYLSAAHRKIRNKAEERSWEITAGQELPPLQGMGTTAVLAQVVERPRNPLLGRWANIAWVGDSRAELHRADGTVEPLTLDDKGYLHAAAQDRAGRLAVQRFVDEVPNPSKLTAAEQVHMRKLKLERGQVRKIATDPMIFGAIGGRQEEADDVHVIAVELRPGDRLDLYTDGLENLTLQERAEIVSSAKSPQAAAEEQTKRARAKSLRSDKARSKKDDVTAVVLEASAQALTLESIALHKGDQIPIRRGSGELEDGWTIRGFNAQTGDVLVEKPYERGTLQKQVPTAEVRATVAVLDCRSFWELARTIQKLPDRQLPLGKERNRRTLIERLKKAATDEDFTLSMLSRAIGLRRKVEELRGARIRGREQAI